jgi:methylated-DNA-[protein]-cysteine S-methyltransferase
MIQIGQYFSGGRKQFAVPFVFPEGARFSRKVWGRMRLIPFGKTATYGDLADSMGSPHACRAVGNACAANPLPLLVPCHRVVGKRGLGGFSAGLGWKRFLLALEKIPNPK